MTTFLLLMYLFTLLAGLLLRLLNQAHLKIHGAVVPAGFEGVIDGEVLRKASAYTLDNSRFGLIETLFDSTVLLLFLFAGPLPLYDRWIQGLGLSPVLSGTLFYLLLLTAKSLLDIPFSLYRTFVIEARYGFNTQTLGLWIADLLKGLAISLVLLGVLLAGGFQLVEASPDYWWLWGWGLFAGFTLFVMLISPYVIEPLFFRFEPVRKEGLEEGIKALMARAGLAAGRVFQVDASRRSHHGNAYFTGIGRVKRIVLFDTLLERLSAAEILAILAHEIGHWKKRHILKRLFATELLALGGFYLAYRLIGWGGVPDLFGIDTLSFAAQWLPLAFLGSLVVFPFTPVSAWLSRRDEGQADGYACALHGNPEDLASALVKLARDNLANLHPHPWYAAFYFSHPPVVERVRRLRAEGK
ncbi:M48 family metallopeptidase [Trichloromonas sp.]|uniref:M48 family metallopeptidase n=1 Tax=Trichloromonas sp. TaxID=3069249 RepID=UPI002A3F107C|nr:M48 family metallopeptidase [Trichloromonas sp.]